MDALLNIKILVPVILAVFLFAFFIWIFYMIYKESKKTSVKTFQDIQSKTVQDLKCPRCNTYMEHGYTIAGKGIFFRDKHKQYKYLSPGNLVPNTANYGFRMKENLAWKCSNCQLLVLDYSFQIKK